MLGFDCCPYRIVLSGGPKDLSFDVDAALTLPFSIWRSSEELK